MTKKKQKKNYPCKGAQDKELWKMSDHALWLHNSKKNKK